jgi:hypothetical protein
MAFDVEGARAAGYSDAEIAEHLAKAAQFDLAGARKAKYADSEVIAHLAGGAELAPPEPSLVARVKDTVTGDLRRTTETEALPDWVTMPELVSAGKAVQAGASPLAPLKAALGSQLAGPDEAAKILQANFPNMGIRQDAKGNYILRSAVDGNEYAIKPGFRASDIGRALFGVASFAPAGRAATLPGLAAGAGATQGAIELSQAATGGEFNPGQVGAAAVLAPVAPVVVNAARAAAQPVRQAVQRLRGVAPAAPAAPAAQTAPAVVQPGGPVAPAAPAAAAPAVVAAPAAQLPVDELGQQMRTAALGGLGSKKATQALAEAAAPDAETVAAARRLGIEQHLQPDHVTTNQAFRQLSQLVKSQTGSQAAVAQREGLEQVAQRAAAVVDEVGGSADVSTVSASVRTRMEAIQQRLEASAERLYGQVRAGVPPKTEAPAPGVLAFIEQRADELGGATNLSPMEKQILSKLKPESGQPTYALLDDVRKDIGAATRMAGPFKDADSGLAKKLYGLLTDDQLAAVEAVGMDDIYRLATAAVRTRKGLEDDMTALFGRQLDKTMTPLLAQSIKKLGAGDTATFVKMIDAVPRSMRQQVTASGLSSFFQRTARGGEMDFAGYARWYEALQRNQQAYTALMTNLPRGSARQLADLARVARGVAMSKGEFLATGKAINPRVLEAADSLMSRVYDEVRRRGVAGLAAETIGTASGAPGLASALASATMSGKPSIAQAADRLISSPEFIAAARAAGTNQQASAARALANSKSFTRFVRAIGQPRELSNRERWVLQAMQAQNQQRQ